MKRRIARTIALLAAVLLLTCACASAQDMVSTTVLMRVSRMTQNAVVDVGEDLSIEVNVDGVVPDRYQWYFNDEPIAGANQKVYNIVNAKPEDSGVYRLDAFDEEGAMLVSMDFAARVVEDVVPKSGDNSMPVGCAFAGIGVCGAALVLLLRRRMMA